ncbi:MAG: hypothetical protein MRY63_03890 [Neomegalonema sp.]|nr:hypothetical protein [Neomegalonema sp.]
MERKAVLFLTAAGEGAAQAEVDRARLRSAFALDPSYTSIEDRVVKTGREADFALRGMFEQVGAVELFVLVLRAPMSINPQGRVSFEFGEGRPYRAESLRQTLERCKASGRLLILDTPMEAQDLRVDDPGGALEAALNLKAERAPGIARRFGAAASVLPALALRLEAVNTDRSAPSLTAMTWALAGEALFFGNDEAARLAVARRRSLHQQLPQLSDDPAYEIALEEEMMASGRDPLARASAPRSPDSEDLDEIEAAFSTEIKDPSLELDAPVSVSALRHRFPRRLCVSRPVEIEIEIADEVMNGGSWTGTLPSRVEPGSTPTGVAAMAIRDPEDAFEITLLSDPVQTLGQDPGRRTWRWRITPKRWGSHPLILHATAYTRDATGRLIPAPAENERVHLAVVPNQLNTIVSLLTWGLVIAASIAFYALWLGPAIEDGSIKQVLQSILI